jgi:hypothetical protein
VQQTRGVVSKVTPLAGQDQSRPRPGRGAASKAPADRECRTSAPFPASRRNQRRTRWLRLTLGRGLSSSAGASRNTCGHPCGSRGTAASAGATGQLPHVAPTERVLLECDHIWTVPMDLVRAQVDEAALRATRVPLPAGPKCRWHSHRSRCTERRQLDRAKVGLPCER